MDEIIVGIDESAAAKEAATKAAALGHTVWQAVAPRDGCPIAIVGWQPRQRFETLAARLHRQGRADPGCAGRRGEVLDCGDARRCRRSAGPGVVCRSRPAQCVDDRNRQLAWRGPCARFSRQGRSDSRPLRHPDRSLDLTTCGPVRARDGVSVLRRGRPAVQRSLSRPGARCVRRRSIGPAPLVPSSRRPDRSHAQEAAPERGRRVRCSM